MKLEVLQENLSKAVNLASRFVNPRAQLPTLTNIALATQKTKLSFFATNLEMSLAISIGAKIKEEGEITLPAKVINDLVTTIKSGTVSLETEGEKISLESNGFSALVAGVNAADFPKVPQSLSKNAIKIETKKFLSGLEKVLFSVSLDETRPILTGVLLLFDKKDLVFVATDGFRLSQKRVHLDKTFSGQRLILPKPVLVEIGRIFGDGEATFGLDIRPNDNQAVFGQNNIFISSRLIDGEFPNFEKVIPKQSAVTVTVDKEELVRAVKAASVFAREAANVIKLAAKKDSLIVSAESTTVGQQEAKVAAKVEGGEVEVNYNYRFLLEILNVIEDDFVQIELTNNTSPGVFKDPKDVDFLHLIMPVKV